MAHTPEELPLDRVRLSGKFDGLERSAATLFRLIRSRGRVVSLVGDFDYHGQPGRPPELRRTEDGQLYPVHGIIDFEEDGVAFRVKVADGYGDNLSVEIEEPVTALATMETLLQACRTQRATVFRDDLTPQAAGAVYRHIIQAASFKKLVPGQPCRIRLGDEAGFLPEKLAMEVELEGRRFLVEFSSRANRYEVAVDVAAEDYAAAGSWLEALVTECRQADSGSDSASLPWEVDASGYTWSSVGGLDELVESLRQWTELPLRNPEGFTRLGIRPPRGILLFGPPGTGKSTLAKVVANESGVSLFAVSPGDINSMWYGGSERNIKKLFRVAREAPRGAVVFIDELDGFLRSRDDSSHEATRRSLAQIMTEMDSLERGSRVIVMGATNRPEDLDPALRRPGRFDHHFCVPLPDERGREAVLKVHLRGKPCGDLDLAALAGLAERQSGADLEQWCNRAAFQAWRRTAEELGQDPVDLSATELAEVRVEQADFLACRNREQADPESERRD